MRLIQMAYLDLDPPLEFDYPSLTMNTDGVETSWAARWADPSRSWTAARKVDEKHPVHARPVFAHPDIEAACPLAGLPMADDLPLTPPWLNPPVRKSELMPTAENGEEAEDGTRYFDTYTRATELLVADLKLRSLPSRDKAGLIRIRSNDLRRAITAIETFADILSLAVGSNREIASPDPPVALVAESDHEWSWLDSSEGIADLGVKELRFRPQFQLDVTRMPPGALNDRPDGLKLLAEVFSQSSPTGRFRELWRYFERAFALPTGKLVAPLADFLGQVDPRFTQTEIQKWVALRGPVVHGDRRAEFALSVDVDPFLPRMESVAYDVLLYKEEWRSPSSRRRPPPVNPSSLAAGEADGRSDLELAGFNAPGKGMMMTLYPVLGCGPLRFTQPEWPISVEGMWAKGPGGIRDAPDGWDIVRG